MTPDRTDDPTHGSADPTDGSADPTDGSADPAHGSADPAHGSADRIYTRAGDDGDTALFGGGRVSKAHVRVEAYGAVDELNAALGWCQQHLTDARLADRLGLIQAELFTVGALLATPPAAPGRRTPWLPPLPDDASARIEVWIDEAAHVLPPLHSFILPGGCAAGAALHLARTICRRAERRVVALHAGEPVDERIIIYLNRLSDLLFMQARLVNQQAGVPEQTWQPREQR